MTPRTVGKTSPARMGQLEVGVRSSVLDMVRTSFGDPGKPEKIAGPLPVCMGCGAEGMAQQVGFVKMGLWEAGHVGGGCATTPRGSNEDVDHGAVVGRGPF